MHSPATILALPITALRMKLSNRDMVDGVVLVTGFSHCNILYSICITYAKQNQWELICSM